MNKEHQPLRIVSGMRPTGKLHLGHYHGVLRNWIRLQNEAECFFFVADLHALTTEYQNPGIIRESSRDILIDWLSVGLDPKKAVIFIQSDVKEHSELHLLLSMMTPIGWLERVPSYKEMQQELSQKDLTTYGFLGYPLLQAADIALYDGNRVPVGMDQVPHIELAREVIRRFNYLYQGDLVEAQPLLTEAPKLLGLDRRKMSKSYDNAIYLSDSVEEVERKMKLAITDPARIKKSDPGNPEICLVYDYHKLHTPADEVLKIAEGCRGGTLGCVEDKKNISKAINQFLDPVREKREVWLKDKDRLEEIIHQGAVKARTVAEKTMQRVRKVMGF